MTSRSDDHEFVDGQLRPVGALEEEVVEMLRQPIGSVLGVILTELGKPPHGTWRRISFDFVELSNGGVHVSHVRIHRIEEPRRESSG